MMKELDKVTAFSPATSANLAVGFDILGFAVQSLGDEITLAKRSDSLLQIISIEGAEGIPLAIDKNTASVALQAMLKHLGWKQGFDISIKKQIPMSSGLGGSAASSVGALVALNHLLISPLPMEQLIEFAMLGEEAACGSKHGDNVIPCLFGGMTLIQSLSPLAVIQLPLIPLHVVLIHPHILLSTKDSRAALKEQVSLPLFSKQNAHLASFISALYETNYERLSASCIDEVIEPMRAHLIPHFYEIKAAAYSEGALACSISGSGPTLFALTRDDTIAQNVAKVMTTLLNNYNLGCDTIITTLSSQGAAVIYEE